MARVNPINYETDPKEEKINDEREVPKEQPIKKLLRKKRKWFKNYIINPESSSRLSWDILLLMVIIYQSLTVPFFISFNVDYPSYLEVIEFISTCIFMIDIITNFNTGYYSKGELIMKRTDIILNYLKLWFWIDLLATFPYTWVLDRLAFNTQSSTLSAPKFIRIIKALKFLRFLKLLRLARLKHILIKIEDYIANNTLVNFFVFIRLLCLVFLLAHWTGCLWFYVGYQDWINGHPITWIVTASVQDIPVFDQYIFSLYWAITTITSVGYGDITPITVNEKIYAMSVMIVSSGVFAYVIGSVGSLISKETSRESSYRDQVVVVNSYMKKNSLNMDLRYRVRRYLDYVWESKKTGINERNIFNCLSEPLRNEIYSHLNSNIIRLCSAFDMYENYFIAQITRTLDTETFAPGDIVFSEGEINSKLYFIIKGKINIFHQSTLSLFRILSSNEYFGEISFFMGTPRCASARCSEFVDLISLVRINLLSLLEKFPEAKEKTKELQRRCKDDDYSSLMIRCYICDQLGHVAAKCQNFIINYNQDDTASRWIELRQEANIINLRGKEPNSNRKAKKINKIRYSGRNVIGKLRPPLNLSIKRDNLYPIIPEKSDEDLKNYSQIKTGLTNVESLSKVYNSIYKSNNPEEAASNESLLGNEKLESTTIKILKPNLDDEGFF
jgi:CRP-like cAMP-binding protein